MTSKLSLGAIATAAILVVPPASYAASKHRGAPTGEIGYSNPGSCLGGACTGENPDRVRQPCSGGSCYKRMHTKKHKSSWIRFEIVGVA
jgi:hypothetical protein